MTLETWLASLHLLALLTLVVFASSQIALCRIEWMNDAVVRRLARLDMLYGWAALALLLSGVVRIVWGAKGIGWYVSQPLFHLKMLLVVVVAILGIRSSLVIRRWVRTLDAANTLPAAQEILQTRRSLMVQAHIVPVVAVIAVFWANGW